MTDPIPLSPAAQAVLDAYGSALLTEQYAASGRIEVAIAAALRAAAEVATPIEFERLWKDGRMEEYDIESLSRKKLLAIAAELEGADG